MSLPVRFLSKSQPLRLLLHDVSTTEGISRMQSILLGSKSVEESFTALAECKQKSFKSLERDRGRNCEDGSRAPRLYSFSFFFYSLFFSLSPSLCYSRTRAQLVRLVSIGKRGMENQNGKKIKDRSIMRFGAIRPMISFEYHETKYLAIEDRFHGK